MLLILVAFAFGMVCAHAKSEFENLVIIKSLADSVLAPVSGTIAEKGNSSFFAPDVKGSLDIFRDVDGQELATEYTFGLFSRASANPTVPSILGEPVGYKVTSLAVEHSYVTANIIVNLSYPLIDAIVPLELGVWAMINPAGQISQFDVSFKRWGWFIQTMTSQLLPVMAAWSGISANDTDTILRGYWSKVICGTDLLTCGSSTFGGMSSCEAFVSTAPLGDLTQIGDDSLTCRGFQAALAPLRPGHYCGPTGAMGANSTVCVTRNYATTVDENHFPHGWLAPKPTSPEGEALYGDYRIINGVPLLPQLEFSLQEESMTSFSISLFSTCTFALWLILWTNAKLLSLAYRRYSRKFRSLPFDVQRTNVVMYVMNIFWTFVALVLGLAGVACYWNNYYSYQMICVRSAGVVICALYAFELVFRWDMRLPLVAHHFLTIFCICWAIALFEQTGNVSFMATGVTWLFQATTEQPTFVALYLYRMAPQSMRVSYLLKGAAIQTLLFKCASAAAVIAIWAIHQRETLRALDVAWSASMFIVAVGLMLTQVWGSWVTWKIGARVAKQCQKSRRLEDLESLRYCQRAEESKFSIDKLELPAELAEARLANARPLAYYPRQQRQSLPRDVPSDIGSVIEKGEKRDSGVLEPFCSPSLLYRYGRLPLSSPGATPAVTSGTYVNLGEVWSPPTPPGSWESQSETRSETPLEIDDSVVGLIDFSQRRNWGGEGVDGSERK